MLQVTKMVLLLQQRAFIVKQCIKHLLKRVCDNFIQEFPNSVSPPGHVILNLIFKKSKTNAIDDLPCLEQTSVVTSEKNVIECATTSP